MLDALNAPTIWFLLGMALMAAELLLPGFILFFFGLGAILTAVTTLLGLTRGTAPQIIVFILASLVSLFLLRQYAKAWFKGKTLQKHEAQALSGDILGKKARVVEDIVPHALRGRVELHGTFWAAEAESPLEKGVTVIVIGRNGLTLTVKPLD